MQLAVRFDLITGVSRTYAYRPRLRSDGLYEMPVKVVRNWDLVRHPTGPRREPDGTYVTGITLLRGGRALIRNETMLYVREGDSVDVTLACEPMEAFRGITEMGGRQILV